MPGNEEKESLTQAGRYWRKSLEHSLEEAPNPWNLHHNITSKPKKGWLKHLQHNALNELEKRAEENNS